MRLLGEVSKGWGRERIWVSNEKFCSKFLDFEEGTKCSMHFHDEKEESWFVLSGEFIVRCLDTADATYFECILKPGQVWHNERLKPHQLICVKKGSILEVSTPDSIEDNFRVGIGDSQK
jgi:mannose-6-phosphate isomerase-like protein (cupin superfamily)